MKNSNTNRSRGFGFVTFADPSKIEAVLANCPHSLDGRTIDPKACNPRSMQKPKKSNGYPKVNLDSQLVLFWDWFFRVRASSSFDFRVGASSSFDFRVQAKSSFDFRVRVSLSFDFRVRASSSFDFRVQAKSSFDFRVRVSLSFDFRVRASSSFDFRVRASLSFTCEFEVKLKAFKQFRDEFEFSETTWNRSIFCLLQQF